MAPRGSARGIDQRSRVVLVAVVLCANALGADRFLLVHSVPGNCAQTVGIVVRVGPTVTYDVVAALSGLGYLSEKAATVHRQRDVGSEPRPPKPWWKFW